MTADHGLLVEHGATELSELAEQLDALHHVGRGFLQAEAIGGTESDDGRHGGLVRGVDQRQQRYRVFRPQTRNRAQHIALPVPESGVEQHDVRRLSVEGIERGNGFCGAYDAKARVREHFKYRIRTSTDQKQRANRHDHPPGSPSAAPHLI